MGIPILAEAGRSPWIHLDSTGWSETAVEPTSRAFSALLSHKLHEI